MSTGSTQYTFRNRLAVHAGTLTPALERVTRLAQQALRVPYALLDIVDGAAVVLTCEVGEEEFAQSLQATTRSQSYISAVMNASQPIGVDDTAVETTLHEHPITLSYGARAYLAAPLIAEDDRSLGMLAVLDSSPHPWSEEDRNALRDLASVALDTIMAHDQRVSSAHNQQLSEQMVKDLSEELIASQKLETVGQLAIGIAHDFNNLLTIILGSAQLAMSDVQPNSVTYNDLDEIYQAATRAARMTRQILSFARQQVTEPQVININELVIDIAKLLRRVINANIELVTLPDPNVAFVNADPGQIEQVLLNLALTSRDSMPHGGKLYIETRNLMVGQPFAEHYPDLLPGLYVSITVRDTHLKQADPVDQHSGESQSSQNISLRLAVAHRIIEQHEGMVLHETPSSEGAVFTLYLPTKEELSPEESNRLVIDYLPHGTETVLLVEDEPLMRSLLARFLRMCGYTVLEATDGDDAMRIVHEPASHPIHILLTDMVMPQVGGNELAKQLRVLLPTIKVIFTSAYHDSDAVAQAYHNADIAFLPKPFLLNELTYKLREVLDA